MSKRSAESIAKQKRTMAAKRRAAEPAYRKQPRALSIRKVGPGLYLLKIS
jgi:hypothetical protein